MIISFLAIIGFSLWVIRNSLSWVRLWQAREYRLDRLSVQLRETNEGKSLYTSPVSSIKWLLLLGYILVVFQDQLTMYYQLTVSLLYVFEGTRVLKEIVTYNQFKRPARTVKAYAIVTLTLIFIVILYFLPMTDMYLWLLLLDRMTVVFVSLFVFFFSFPTEIYTNIIIQKAKRQLARHEKLLIIAVSGSYGKSSTKEFVAHILSEKFTIVKTFGSNNTPIGIAKTILNKINDQTDIFVVEMGAYKRGEIAELCAFVQPNISITTSVSDQHLSLYGSLKNAIETEKELIQALPKDGLALFNGNNRYSEELFKKCKKKKVLYYSSNKAIRKLKNREEKIEGKNNAIIATKNKVEKDNLKFDVFVNGKTFTITAPLLGGHMIENLLPGIYIAKYLGLSDTQIRKAVKTIAPPPKTMIKKTLANDAIIIDDSFNASPESVQAALDYLKIYQTKKIFVLTPLIELGKNAKSRHGNIGHQIGDVCDYLFLTNRNFYKDIANGLAESSHDCRIFIGKPDEIAKQIESIIKKGDVVMFEGKEAGTVLQRL